MQGKFVVRLLDDAGALLGWTTVMATSQPFNPERPRVRADFYPDVPTKIRLTAAGLATQVVIHWCDVNVVRVEKPWAPLEIGPEHVGADALYVWTGPVWGVQGMDDVPMPAVTEGAPLVIGVPPGDLAAIGIR